MIDTEGRGGVRSFLSRMRAIFSRQRLHEESDDEFRFHLEMEIGHHRARGLSSGEARTAALISFGGVQRFRDETRETRGGLIIDDLRQNVRIAIRRLGRTPGFTIAATLTLAISIGATASVFGVVDAVVFKAFPFREPNRVLTIMESNLERHLPRFTISPADYLDYRSQNHSFSDLAASTGGSLTVTGGAEPERLAMVAVTPSYFPVLGITPAIGRALSVDSSGAAEVLVSHGYWKRRFGGSPSAVGQTLILDDHPYTIVGVMPAGLPDESELWTRLSIRPGDLEHRDWHYLVAYGRLKDGVTAEAAQRELETIAQRLAQTYPDANKNWSAMTIPLLDYCIGVVRSALVLVLCAAACVLLIGAANMANLFLVRGLARERELAVRTALGASRGRLVGELLVEAVILGAVAGALGGVSAIGGVRILCALAPPTLPRLSQVSVDARVVAFCAAASIVTVIIFGVLPAWHTARGDLANSMREGGRGTLTRQRRRMQDALVVLQVAVALVLLTSTGLLVEGFDRFRHAERGYRTDGVLTASVALSGQRYRTPEQNGAFAARVAEQLARQPGVDAAAVSSAVPGTAWTRWAVTILDDPAFDQSHAPLVRPVFISPDYFRTLGITLLRGRGILPSDDRRAVKVAIVDERLTRTAFGAQDPIGRRFTFVGPDTDTVEIVGVSASVKQGGIVAEEVPWVFVSLAQAPFATFRNISVHGMSDPQSQTVAIRRVIASLDSVVPVYDVKPMSVRAEDFVGLNRFATFLASLFAAIALALGIVGIYSVLSYVVTQRRRETAIRLALGASRMHVVSAVLRAALVLAAGGIVLGSIAAWGATRVLAGVFEGVSPHDPGIFIGAAILFAVVAMAAAALPAFRTTRINPASVLSSQ